MSRPENYFCSVSSGLLCGAFMIHALCSSAVALFAPYFLLVKGCNNDRVNIEVIELVLEVLFKNSTYVYFT